MDILEINFWFNINKNYFPIGMEHLYVCLHDLKSWELGSTEALLL